MKYALDDIREKQVLPGLHAKFIHSENMSFVYWRIEKGADLPNHSHPHEQVVNMLEGELDLRVDNKTIRLRAGDIYVIPPHMTHGGMAATECKLLDVFYPLREDYIVQ